MLIQVHFKKTLVLVAFLFMLYGFGIAVFDLGQIQTTVAVDEEFKEVFKVQVQEMFDQRNQAILEKNQEMIENIYDQGVKYGRWACAHELKKLAYLHKWSDKQGVEFKTINSQVIVRWVKKGKGEGVTANLMVATEYQYVYEDTVETINSFRIGTHHSLDLEPRGEEWVITREWYTDPFADSLALDDLKNQEIKKLILSEELRLQSVELNERRKKAVEYADQYCGAASLPEHGFRYNRKYRDFNHLGGDCANFASQMLHEGGGFRKNQIWNYEGGEGSRAWLNAHAFNQYMIYNGRASRIAYGTYEQVLRSSFKLLPGDYVAYEKKGKVVHVSVVTGVDSKGYPLVNCHNTDRYRVPWDLGWSNKGIRFWLVRVHY